MPIRHSWFRTIFTGTFALLLCSALLTAADTPSTPVASTADSQTNNDDAGKDKKHRLPQFYAQVISPDQREKIYAVQDRYAPRFEELETKLAALRAELDVELRSVLTPEQQKRLDSLIAAANAKQQNKASQNQKKGAASSKPATAKASGAKSAAGK